jgi:predicted anti-sigma-YlaC factor YlaD
MSVHIEPWLDAYLDGELPGAKARQVEAHLSEGGDCRALLEQRECLSALLQEAPAAPARKTPARFAANVRLQLRVRPEPALPAHQALRWAWIAAPVLLVLALVFVQSTLLLSTLLSFIPGVSQALQAGTTGTALFDLPPIAGELLSFALPLNLFNGNFLTGLVLLLAIGLLYVGWLAGWWARSRRNNESMD